MTIQVMQREILVTIMERAQGLERVGSGYCVKPGHDVVLYLGEPGRAMAIGAVQEVGLEDAHLEIAAKGKGTFYVSYEAVHALSDKQHDGTPDRPGGVGFE